MTAAEYATAMADIINTRAKKAYESGNATVAHVLGELAAEMLTDAASLETEAASE